MTDPDPPLLSIVYTEEYLSHSAVTLPPALPKVNPHRHHFCHTVY